jgi:hypothetical protein
MESPPQNWWGGGGGGVIVLTATHEGGGFSRLNAPLRGDAAARELLARVRLS